LFNFVKKNLPFEKLLCFHTGWRKNNPGGLTMIREESAGTVEIRQEDLAYRSGWEDGRFGSPEIFVANANLAAWTEYLDRLAYYRGHRDGRRVREMLGVSGQGHLTG
jgi:hypothetical protein